jgi:ribose transport system substrate-binding protein
MVVIGALGGCGRERPASAPAPGAAAATGTGGTGGTGPTIAVIPKGTTHVFWKSVERGAQRAGEELGARITWKGPLTENDRAQQIQLVQQFLAQGVDGLVMAPLDYKALVPPVRAATERGIPVVIFDSELEGRPGRDFVSFVATDNRSAGRMGGQHLATILGGAGDVVLLRYQVGSASTDNREGGFLEAMAAHGSIQVLSENRYAGATAGEAKTAAINLMEVLRAAEGVFCPNESSTLGMLLALRQEGLAGTLRFVGFDASPPLLEALRAGEIDALVVQDPQAMGYRAVAALLAHRRGETVEAVIDTGAVVVTRDNLDTPDIRRLLE